MAERTATLASLGLRGKAGRDALVRGLAVDSRAVGEGFLFAALPGSAAHGASFIPAALARGAGAVLTDAEGARLAAEALAGTEAALIVVAVTPSAGVIFNCVAASERSESSPIDSTTVPGAASGLGSISATSFWAYSTMEPAHR